MSSKFNGFVAVDRAGIMMIMIQCNKGLKLKSTSEAICRIFAFED